MLMDVPALSADDLRGELATFHRQPHRTRNTAFFGTLGNNPDQAADALEVLVGDQQLSFDVVQVRCELELRRQLGRAEERGRPVALLVDYHDRLPLDVQGRLAGGGLQYISRERRLANLFGLQRLAPALVESALGKALLHLGWRFPLVKTGPTVDLATGWRCFLARAINLPSEETLTEEGVLSFFARRSPSTADPLLGKVMEQVPELAADLEDYWARTVGPVAAISWRFWQVGRGRDVAALAFVLDALQGSQQEGAVKVFLSLRLKEFWELRKSSDTAAATRAGAVTATTAAALEDLRERWGRLAPALDRRLAALPDVLTDVLRRADTLVDEPVLQAYLQSSRFLKAGFVGMKAELASRLNNAVTPVDSDGAGLVKREDVLDARELFERLSEHRLADAAENLACLERARMGLRLLAFLSVRNNWQTELKGAVAAEPMFRLAEAYAGEGGFVDLARTRVRGGHDSDPLDAAVGRVAAAADTYRDQMDRLFARGLERWNLDRSAERVLPIENALAELGVGFLSEKRDRRLLILLMDGMSWASAAEVIVAVREIGYSPLRWRPGRPGRLGFPPAMIAALPTMTEVSRAALFAGKLMAPGEQLSTMRDPERLQQHKAFCKAFGDGPKLLLRTDAESQTGELTEAARKLVAGEDRVVGVVLNAIDDQLTGKPSYEVHANRTTIKALEPLLKLAAEATRAVLMIGDHGHVVSSRPHTGVDAGKTEKTRYRELAEGEAPVAEREIVLAGNNAYTERKGRRLAMLYAETDRYVSQRHVGEHGGASLAEVVTPALMMGSQDLRTLAGEEGEALDVVAYPVPAWWHLDVPVDQQAARQGVRQPERQVGRPALAAPSRGAGRGKPVVSESQLVLTSIVPAPPPPAVDLSPAAAAPPASGAWLTEERGTPSKWAARLTDVFADLEKGRKQDLVKRVIPAVDLLVEHRGRVAEEVFAGYLGEAPRNVGGRVALIAEFLNEDCYQVIEHDSKGKQVTLDLALLEELFGG